METPTVNWVEDGENYEREMKVKGFIKKANRNEEWASLPKEVKALSGV